ncbi:MAG: aspartate carbamoyltransferase [Planctomycetota bacterium]|nr:aspartate carbamoyltransferase [Planctomycetota bacterium]
MVTDQDFVQRDVITVNDFRREEILHLLDVAERFERPVGPLLAGRVIATLFFEPSTRTRLSFESAVGRLGGVCIGFAEGAVSSQTKGESLADTVRVVEGYSDLILIRHPNEGSARLAAEFAKVPVVNCGDGAHQHPTQTFVDLYTLRRECGRLDELNVVFVGDLRYGRTVHSLVMTLADFDARMTFVSPEFLRLPREQREALEGLGVSFKEARTLDGALADADVIYVTRIQQERFTDPIEFEKVKGSYRVDADTLAEARPQVVILHPLPRLEEIAPEVDRHPHAAYFRQAHYGVAVRKALLALLLGCASEAPA